MGNICSKSSNQSDPFSQPGRVVGSAPSQPSRASAPSQKITSNTPGRTLGGSSSLNEARSAAARAAEERAAKNSSPKGKLGSQLQQQKQQTRADTLGQARKDERRLRELDEGRRTGTWD